MRPVCGLSGAPPPTWIHTIGSAQGRGARLVAVKRSQAGLGRPPLSTANREVKPLDIAIVAANTTADLSTGCGVHLLHKDALSQRALCGWHAIAVRSRSSVRCPCRITCKDGQHSREAIVQRFLSGRPSESRYDPSVARNSSQFPQSVISTIEVSWVASCMQHPSSELTGCRNAFAE